LLLIYTALTNKSNKY